MLQVLDLFQERSLRLQEVDTSARTISYPFRFLPATQNVNSTENSIDDEMITTWPSGQQLPPSLERKSSLSSDLRGDSPQSFVSVTYDVQAKVCAGTNQVAYTSRGVDIFPSSTIAPPLFIENSGTEYTMSQKSSLKRAFLQRVGSMIVHCPQPEPFVYSETDDCATTKVLLQVKLSIADGILQGSHPGILSATVDWKLRSSTIVSMQEQSTSSMPRQLRSSALSANIGKDGSMHDLKMLWSSWTKLPSSTPKRSEWTSVQPMLLSCPSVSSMPPTFTLPKISHRYTLILNINVSEPYRSKASLRVPIQVVYQSGSAGQPIRSELERICSIVDVNTDCISIGDDDEVWLPPY